MDKISKFPFVLFTFCICTVVSAQDQVQPVRVMQETPWVISPMSSAPLPMRPVSAYWDPQATRYFIDFVSFLEEVHMSVEVQNATVRAIQGHLTYDVDFAGGTFIHQSRSKVQYQDSLETDGYFRSGDRFLLTPSNLQRVFPQGTLSYDSTKLHIRLSHELFAGTETSFRRQVSAPTLDLGPMLYGRNRRLIGGTQLGYRLNRTQHTSRPVNYSGFLSARASALWGQISADATVSYTDADQTKTTLRRVNYLLDFPESVYITQVGLGRTRVDQWPARKSYEGVRLGNRPLSTRHQQREAEVRGIAEPNALVSALIGGVVADRVQADGQGRYKLTVPAYYGTSRVEVETVPAGGGVPTRNTRYLFITEDLVPAGRFYWDLQGGRDQYDHTPYGHIHFSYGLSRGLTALSSFTRIDTMQTATLGLVKNLAESMMVSAQVGYPGLSGRATLQMFRDRFQVQGEAAIATESGFSFYKQRFMGRIGWNANRVSFFLNGSRFESFGGSTSMRLDGSTTVRVARRVSLVLAAGPGTTQLTPDAPVVSRLRWRSTLTRYVTPGSLRGRLGFQVDGGRYEDIDFAGMTLYASYRAVSFGARVGYDVPAQTMHASFSIRMNAPWASFSSQAVVDPENSYNQQSLYGSMELSRDLLFTRHPQIWSSARLRPFIDMDRNGRRDASEMPLEGLNIDVVRARTESDESGGVFADFLAPSTRYQVVIDPRSIQGPELSLPTGNNFSFVSDPGEVKHIDIPVHKNTIVEGTVEDLPLSSPTLAVVVIYDGDQEVTRAAVSQQGRFTVLLPPGAYRLELLDLLDTEDLSAYTQNLNVEPVNTQYLQIR